MGKLELENIKKHLKIRMRDSKGIKRLCDLLLIVFIIDLCNIISDVFHYQADVKLYNATVYSTLGLGLTLIAAIYYLFQYGEYNEKHQIFPQSSTTRFVSFELYCYFINIITQAIALCLYLAQYLICLLLNHFKGNLRLAYRINIPFMITGFFVSLLYGFILLSILFFIGFLINKLRWWALLVYITLFITLLITGSTIIGTVLRFYLRESSLLLFLLKAIITWFIFVLLNHILYAKNDIITVRKFIYPNIIIASVILISILFNFLFTQLSFHEKSTTLYDNNAFNPFKDEPSCIVNAGSLPAKSILKINLDQELKAHSIIWTGDTYTNNSENEIRIFYNPESVFKDDISLISFTNPRITSSLQGNTLSVSLVHDKNIKIVSVYPYDMLMQFKFFQGKKLAAESSGSVLGDKQAALFINVPSKKDFNIHY